jgi:hypothetical protein
MKRSFRLRALASRLWNIATPTTARFTPKSLTKGHALLVPISIQRLADTSGFSSRVRVHVEIPATRGHEVRGGAWKVDRALVTTIKNRLQEAAANPASGRGMDPNLPAVSDYFVQVQGQVDNGKRVVELFGACGMGAEEARYLNWQMFMIFDGGPCLFSGKFDVESQRFVWFNFNGPA